jgi:hypothetical protein
MHNVVLYFNGWNCQTCLPGQYNYCSVLPATPSDYAVTALQGMGLKMEETPVQ